MKYTCLYRHRRVITVLLIVNLLIGPLAAATAAKLNPFAGWTAAYFVQGPTDFIRRISLKTNDLVYRDNDWVDVLTNGRGPIPPGDFRHLIFGFVWSVEYRQRFGP